MRVIAGAAKGRRLTGVQHGTVRPTTDRVREALFSTLGPTVAGARVLDLFAGSGAVGIEALSRGAAEAVFVDSDPQAVASIRANLALTGLEGGATVLRMAAERFVERPPGQAGTFDLAYLDPPYALGFPAGLLEALGAGSVLAPGAEVVVECRAMVGSPPAVPGFRVLLARRYGDSSLVFLRAEPAGADTPGPVPT